MSLVWSEYASACFETTSGNRLRVRCTGPDAPAATWDTHPSFGDSIDGALWLEREFPDRPIALSVRQPLKRPRPWWSWALHAIGFTALLSFGVLVVIAAMIADSGGWRL